MNNRNTKLIIFTIVLAVILIAGGITYVSITAVNAEKFQTVTATVTEITTEEKSENVVTVTDVTVRYETPVGTVESNLEGRLPKELKDGASLTVRYKKSDVSFVTTEHVDFGTPIFLLVIGVLYAVGSGVFICLRKKAGDYALYDGTVEGDGVFDDDEQEASPDEQTEQPSERAQPELKD